jgi:hypothetical protein
VIPQPPTATVASPPEQPIELDAPLFVDEPILVDDPILLDESFTFLPSPADSPSASGARPDHDPFRPLANPSNVAPGTRGGSTYNPQAQPLGGPHPSWGVGPAYAANPHLHPHKQRTKSPLVMVTKVCGMAILVFACINAILIVVNAIIIFSSDGSPPTSSFGAPRSMTSFMRNEEFSIERNFGRALGLVLGLGFSATMGYGGFQMFRLQQWGMALTGAILAAIPCNCLTCLLTTPLGITGIVMVCQAVIKKEFQ